MKYKRPSIFVLKQLRSLFKTFCCQFFPPEDDDDDAAHRNDEYDIMWRIIVSGPVWPDWAIYCTLGNFSKSFATINLPKSPTFLGNFCKAVKIFNFSSEIIFGQLLQTFGNFYTDHTAQVLI